MDMMQLLDELDADFHAAKEDGVTPAYVASQKGHVDVLRLMGEIGVNFNAATGDGSTPLHVACLNGDAK